MRYAVPAWDGEPILTAPKPKRTARSKAEGWHTAFGDGCKHSPSCFTCPLPDCVWNGNDSPNGYESTGYDCPLCTRKSPTAGGLRLHIRRRHGHGFEHLIDKAAPSVG